MSSRYIVLIYLVIMFFNHHNNIYGSDVDEFVKNADVRWRSICEEMEPLKLTDKITLTNLNGEKIVNTVQLLCFPNYISEKTDKESGITHVSGLNEKYRFILKGRLVDNTWEIVQIDPINNKLQPLSEWIADPEKDKKSYNILFRDSYRPLIIVGDFTCLELLSLPEFVVDSIDTNLTEVSNEIIVNFHIQRTKKDLLSKYQFDTGRLTLDAVSFLIKKAEVFNSDDQTTSIIIENEYTGFPIHPQSLKKNTEKVLNNGIVSYSRIAEGKVETVSDIDKTRFTLSHYGLPEPDFGESRSNRIRYILITLGMILILLVCWQMYRKRCYKV